MSSTGTDRTLVVRLWMERRAIDGLDSELRASMIVAGEDSRTVSSGLNPTRTAADELLVRLASEMGDMTEPGHEA